MQIFDGVLFARKKALPHVSEWYDHQIMRGGKPRMVKRRDLPGKKHDYMELDEFQRSYGGENGSQTQEKTSISQPDSPPGRTEPAPRKRGQRSVDGGAGSGSPGRPGGTSIPAGAERIVTARPDLTPRADPGLVPEGLRGVLREHQVQGVAAAIASMDAHGGFLLADGTGVGKSRELLATGQTYAMRGKKVLIVTKAEVIRPDWKKGTVTGSFHTDGVAMGIATNLNDGSQPLVPGQVNVTTYDRLGRIKDKVDNDTVLLFDECFPGDVPVLTDRGLVRIGQIVDERLPVRVLSRDVENGVWEWKKVVRWIRNPLVSGLVRVKHDCGHIVCTPHHKVWVEGKGYVVASELQSGDCLRLVPEGRLCAKVAGEETEVLFDELLSEFSLPEHARRSNGEEAEKVALCKRGSVSRKTKSCCCGENEDRQSDEECRDKRKGVEVVEGQTISCCSWRQWQVASGTTLDPSVSSWQFVDSGNGCEDTGDSPSLSRRSLAESLQAGSGQPGIHDHHRDRRNIPQVFEGEGSGCQKKPGCEFARVEAVEVLKQDDIERLAGRSGRDSVCVYNLEVEDNHNYIAAGVLVSNSHSLKNWQSARAKHGFAMSKVAHAVLYATATPADKPLHIAHLFRARVFGYRKWEETWRGLGMIEKQIRVPGGKTITQWQINPAVGTSEVYRRMSGLFNRMTQEGLMLKREISFSGVDVDFRRVELPPEAHEILNRVEDMVENQIEAPGLQRALTLMHQRRQQETFKIPAVVDMAREEMAAGRQVVIFASRVNESSVGDEDDPDRITSEGTAPLLRDALIKAGVPANQIGELHGGVSPNKRRKAMEDFQASKAKVIIATVEAGGTGVNLDDTIGDRPRTMIMMTAPFSAVENVQAAGRVWRLNTKSYPRLRYVFGDTDVDDWNAALIAGKMRALGAAVAGQINYLDVPSPHQIDLPLEEQTQLREQKMRQAAANPDEPYEWPSLVSRPTPVQRPATTASDTASPAATSPTEPAQKPQVPVAGLSDRRREAIHRALRHLADMSPDGVRERNEMGFNGFDLGFGMDLASKHRLTDRQAHAAARMLHKYRRQLGDELHRLVVTDEGLPPVAPPAPSPGAAQPASTGPAPAVVTRLVQTRYGPRHVHSLTPGQKLHEAHQSNRLPRGVSMSRNPRTGRMEASIWGNTPEEVAESHRRLRRDGFI